MSVQTSKWKAQHWGTPMSCHQPMSSWMRVFGLWDLNCSASWHPNSCALATMLHFWILWSTLTSHLHCHQHWISSPCWNLIAPLGWTLLPLFSCMPPFRSTWKLKLYVSEWSCVVGFKFLPSSLPHPYSLSIT